MKHKIHKINTDKKIILIDGGYHIGSYTKQFLEVNPKCHKIYAFEPMKFNQLKQTQDISLYDQAIWTSDGSCKMFISSNPEASSLMENSIHIDTDDSITVSCLDFSKWLNRFDYKEHYIHLKLDIEGAEYDVVNKLINDGTIKLISDFVCEWHRPRRHRSHKIKEQLKSFSNVVHIQDWH